MNASNAATASRELPTAEQLLTVGHGDWKWIVSGDTLRIGNVTATRAEWITAIERLKPSADAPTTEPNDSWCENQPDAAIRICVEHLPALEKWFRAQGALPQRDVRLLLDMARVLSGDISELRSSLSRESAARASAEAQVAYLTNRLTTATEVGDEYERQNDALRSSLSSAEQERDSLRGRYARSLSNANGQITELLHERDSLRLSLSEAGRERDADRLDAERWRAFIGSQRIRFFGTAGPDEHGYAHFGGEFWTLHPDADSATTQSCREWLTLYADTARAALEQEPPSE